jgi:signal transduction histidine kinase
LKQELTSVNGQLSQAHRFFERELVERTRGEQALRQLEWLLAREKREDANRGEGIERESFQQPYGNPAELNEMRQVLDAVGEGVLADILSDFLDLLDTSAAVYEKNGDYALSTFTSGWCRYLNAASRDLCETDDNRAALEGGKWLCHESCWKRAALPAIESGEPQDILCSGGLHVHARPVFSDQEVVGSIKLAYGSPPNDPEKLKEIAEQYRVPVEELMRLAEEYEARTPLVIELARKRLEVSARLIGALVERRQADDAQKQALAALRENEAELKQLLVAVERSNRELEEFAFVASHDLQEPLRKIQAFGDRLLERAEGRLEESDRDYLLRMRNAAARMQEMIGGLLTLSRVTSQGQPFEPVDLNQVVKEAVSDLEMRVHSTSGQVIVEDLPVLQGDPLQLRQLMQNLISNGLKYHREGVAPVVRISYQEAELPEQGRRAALLVEDNGIGFEESNAEVIFQPFRRLHGRNQYEGTGMGLAICRKIAERHGWKISANSQPGRGSIFKIMMEA